MTFRSARGDTSIKRADEGTAYNRSVAEQMPSVNIFQRFGSMIWFMDCVLYLYHIIPRKVRHVTTAAGFFYINRLLKKKLFNSKGKKPHVLILMVPYRTRKAILRAIKSGYQNSRGPITFKKRGTWKKMTLSHLFPTRIFLMSWLVE